MERNNAYNASDLINHDDVAAWVHLAVGARPGCVSP